MESPGVSTTKRSACDRCRSQKLRCSQSSDGAPPPCTRCVRIGAECQTSYPRQSGWVARVPGRVPGPSRTVGMLLSPTISDTSPAALQPQSLWPWLAWQDDGRPDPLDFVSREALASAPPGDSMDFLGTENAGSLASGSDPSIHMSDQLAADDIANYCFPPPLQSRTPWGSIESSGRATEAGTSMNRRRSALTELAPVVDRTTNSFECDPRLSSLALRLSRRRQRCRARSSQPQDIDMASSRDFVEESASSTGGGGTRGEASSTSMNTNTYGDALSDTSDLIDILRSYSGTCHNASTSNSRPSLGIIIVLDFLSAYLQLVDIYDHLLASLYEQLCNSVKGSDGGLQTLPGLSLAGFSVEQGNLQTNILLQAILHQFETIERSLGLPVELRVSDRKDAYPMGLVHGERAENLFKVVMENTTTTQGSADTLSRPKILASLRVNIEHVRGFLDR